MTLRLDQFSNDCLKFRYLALLLPYQVDELIEARIEAIVRAQRQRPDMRKRRLPGENNMIMLQQHGGGVEFAVAGGDPVLKQGHDDPVRPVQIMVSDERAELVFAVTALISSVSDFAVLVMAVLMSSVQSATVAGLAILALAMFPLAFMCQALRRGFPYGVFKRLIGPRFGRRGGGLFPTWI